MMAILNSQQRGILHPSFANCFPNLTNLDHHPVDLIVDSAIGSGHRPIPHPNMKQ